MIYAVNSSALTVDIDAIEDAIAEFSTIEGFIHGPDFTAQMQRQLFAFHDANWKPENLPQCLDCGERKFCGFADSDRNYGPICGDCYQIWKEENEPCPQCGR